MMTTDAVTVAEVILSDDHGTLHIDREVIRLDGVGDELRAELLQRVTAWARTHGRAVRVRATGPDEQDTAEFVVSAVGELQLLASALVDAGVTAVDQGQAVAQPEPVTARRAWDFGDDEALATVATAQPLGRPLVVLVANTKGESGKTPLAVLLGQAFGSLRPGDVCVVDLDPTGNLAARAGTGRSTPSVPGLVAGATRAQEWSDVTKLLAWHPDSRMWVVAARDPESPEVDGSGHLAAGALATVITALAKGVRVIILDAGNNERDVVFREAAALADQLVVPVRWDVPTVRDGAGVLLRSLYAQGHQKLATEALIVGTYPFMRRPNRGQEQRFRAEFERMGHQVIDMPSDGHIDQRSGIVWGKLRRRTQAAALGLADNITAAQRRRGAREGS